MASIVVVEDDPSVARLLELSFVVDGHEVEVLETGTAALRRLEVGGPDLLVLDLMLPDLDGLSILDEVRARAGWDGTRVVVLTALDSDDDIWGGWSRGADYYLTKPFDLTHLRAVIERLLAGDDLSGSSFPADAAG